MSTVIRLLVVAAVIVGGIYVAHLHSVIEELEGRLVVAETAADSKSEAPPPAVAAAQGVVADDGEPRVLSPDQRAAMVAALSADGLNFGSPVWFQTVANDPEAQTFQKALQSAFEDAGWIVKQNAVVGFSMKPGVYLFAAEEDPPDYVDAVAAAMEAGGIALASNGRGYRSYYEERKKENPQWVGFEMADDQTFVLAIGRRSAPES